MNSKHIVVHYHELWLKGGNRRFFLGKLITAIKKALEGLGEFRLHCPGDRIVIWLGEGVSVEAACDRLSRMFGIAYFAAATELPRSTLEATLDSVAGATCAELAQEQFSTFAVRAKRSDKSYPHSSGEIEKFVGRALLDRLNSAGRPIRVNLSQPEITARIEITERSVLIYARKIAGVGGLPANTAGRMLCLLSGGFDSAVAAWKMMRRGAHLTFVHFWGGGSRPGESSIHVARKLVSALVPWQFTARLYLVPFEPLQREIVGQAPENFRILLYRRLMLRIANEFAQRGHALGIVTGDSLGQVASQTLHNMQAVGAVSRFPIYRPLAGDDKQEIIQLARRIGTHDISAEPFHDCCPVFMPRTPALHASPADLDRAEETLDISSLVSRGVAAATLERFALKDGQVERVESARADLAPAKAAAN